MDASAPSRTMGAAPIFAGRKCDGPSWRSARGFTLVELLVVIVIIGILASLLTGAVVASRAAARRAVIRSEINQLEMALEQYKNQVGEYPPDFSWLNQDNDPTTDTPAEAVAKAVLTRHLRRRFPRYAGDWDAAANDILLNYGVDITRLDPASALVFWLGGLPENNTGATHPAGFFADPTNPFRPGIPRTQPFYDFDPERLEYASGSFLRYRYHPQLPAGVAQAPFVYFRAQRAPDASHTYEFMGRDPNDNTKFVAAVRSWPSSPDATVGLAVPYIDPVAPDPNSPWRSESTYQIISAGLDGAFGDHAAPPSPTTLPATPLPGPPMTYGYPVTRTGTNFTEGDFDNMASFAAGKLEDELQ